MIPTQHRKHFKVGSRFVPHQNPNAVELSVRAEYKPSLSSLESAPVIMAYCSADDAPERQIQFFEVTSGIIQAVFFLEDKVLAIDDAVHFQVFTRVYADGTQHFMPAGHAMIPVRTIEQGGLHRLELNLVSVSHNREDGVVKNKGMISVSGLVSKPRSYMTFGDYNITPENRERIDRFSNVEATKVMAPLNIGLNNGPPLKPYARELHNIRCLFYDTPVARIPGAMYFAMLDMPPADPAALRFLISSAIKRRGFSEEAFITAARTLATGGPKLSYEEYKTLDAAAEGLTLLPNSIPYLSDFATTADGWMSKSKLQIVELFDDALRRLTGDCEDFAKIIGWTFRSVCKFARSDDPLLSAWADILGNYVPCASLLSVVGAKHGDGDDISGVARIDDPSLFSRVGAHMACFLISAQYFMESMKVTTLPAGIAGSDSDVASRPGMKKKYHTLTLEGTGQMCSMLDTYSTYMKDGGTLYHDEQLISQRFFAPDMGPNSSGVVEIPRFLQHWEERSKTPSDSLTLKSSPNNFYRIPCWFSVMGADLPTVNGRSVRNVIPVTEGRYGIPIMHLVRRLPVVLLPSDAYEEDTMKVVSRVKRHLAPAAPISRPMNIQFTSDIQTTFKRFKDAGERIMPKKPKNKETRALVRTRKLTRELEDDEIKKFWNYMAENQFVQSVDCWLEHVYDGLANIVVSINVHP